MRRIEDPPEVDGVLGTAVRQATRYRAAIVRPIKVRSAAIRDADGTAIELKLTPALSVWRTSRQTHPEFCRENFGLDLIGPSVAVDRSNRDNCTGALAALRRTDSVPKLARYYAD